MPAVVGRIYKQSSVSGKSISMNNLVTIYECTEVINEPTIIQTEANNTGETTRWNNNVSVTATTSTNNMASTRY